MAKISPAPAQIADIIRSRGYKNIAEVGVYGCGFCKQLLYAVEDILDNYYLIDPYPHGYIGGSSMGVGWDNSKWDDLYFRACKMSVDHKSVKMFRLTSVEASKLFTPGYLDLVYIDADHKYESVAQDIDHWLPKIRKGGVISGHDYGGGWQGVVEAVDEKFEGKHTRGKKSVWWIEV